MCFTLRNNESEEGMEKKKGTRHTGLRKVIRQIPVIFRTLGIHKAINEYPVVLRGQIPRTA